jgi:2-(1,2-epoxy-1,2-dihydrophenyl)acetyl-CoA isomerase
MVLQSGVDFLQRLHLSIASEIASFIIAYSGIGLSPDGSATYFLSRLVGLKKATEIIFMNEPIRAVEALQLGIVNQVLSTDEFEKGVSVVARKLAQGPTATYGRTKKLIRKSLYETLETQLENERQGMGDSSQHNEFREGVLAFVEKRQPVWTF